MRESTPPPVFHSLPGAAMLRFIEYKRSLGYKYCCEAKSMERFDRFLQKNHPQADQLSQAIIDAWCARTPHERPRTQRNRMGVIRQFVQFLRRGGIEAGNPVATLRATDFTAFVPCIFTREQVGRILKASTQSGRSGHSPLKHLAVPAVFHLLYGCGLRAGEALALKVRDVDLDAGVLTIMDAKFGKDRLVPFAPSVLERLRLFSQAAGERPSEDYFFASPMGGRYCVGTYNGHFRRLLRKAGIPHGGPGQGPRMHDLRHTFAVHRLEQWYHQGEDLSAKLAVLSVYMGHQSLAGTQRYLRLTPEIFPDIQQRVDERFGHVIPSGDQS